MTRLLKKLKLPKVKIKRENFVVAGLVVIALAIPLTVALAGVRQELRKRAAPATGSILINDGDATTNSRNVRLTLTAPTQQASLIKPKFKVPQAHAAGCSISANPNPCTVQPGQVACTSTISWTTDDDIYIYVYDAAHPGGQTFSYVGAGSYSQTATWITCTDTFTFVGVGVNDGIEKCRLNVTGRCAAPPTPTPTPLQECKFNPWQDEGCGYPCARSDRMYQTRTATADSPDWCNDGYLYPVYQCIVDPACGPTPTPTPPCLCGAWQDVECGGWVCADDAMHQRRTCTPAGCDTENRCPWRQSCAGITPTQKPDLTCYGIEIQPPNPTAGQNVKFKFTYKNVGDATPPASAGKVFVDDQLIYTTILTVLGPGESRTKDWFPADGWTATAGSHTVRVGLDTQNAIEESNENNNECSKTFTVASAPTVVGMKISNDSNFSGASEEAFATTKSWTLLPGADGERKVYAKFKWSNGTWTQRVEDSIDLITVGPTPTPGPCVLEGEVGNSLDGDECCEGLTQIDNAVPPDCVAPTDGSFRCTYCPNGTCGPGENYCNCPDDCPQTTPTATPTPTPTPPEGEPTAYLDKIKVGCHPWQLTYARFSVTAWGHSNTGGEVGFAFTLSKAGYNYTAQSGLVPAQGAGQHGAEVGYWIYFQNDVNQLFHWPETCCRKGDYTLTAYAATVERDPVTGEIRKTSDWSAPNSVTVTVYTPPGDPFGHVTCDPTEGGEIEVEKPVISNLNHTITGDTGSEGYANINITYNTNIEADCRTILDMWVGSDYNQQGKGRSTGTSHSYSDSEWYSAAASKSYRYQPICAKKGYFNLPDTWAYSDYGYFTLPSGGGSGGGAPPLGANDADLNGSGDVDIGDWGSLVDGYGQEGEGLPADFNGNGEVDILDVSKFIDAYRRYAK